MNKPLLPRIAVNGVEIPPAAIAAEAQNHAAPKGKPGLAWMAAARALVLRQLMLDEAQRRGLTADPQEVAPGQFETDEEALLRAVIDEAVTVIAPSEDEVRALWLAEPDRFRSAPLWSASHILLTGEGAAERAALVATDLAAKPAAFANTAREISQCPSAANAGNLGQLTPGQTVPPFEAALRQLKEGEITAQPVETQFGWHVIRLDAHAPGRPLPFETVAPRIREAMEKKHWVEAMHAFAQRLLDAADVEGISLQPAAA